MQPSSRSLSLSLFCPSLLGSALALALAVVTGSGAGCGDDDGGPTPDAGVDAGADGSAPDGGSLDAGPDGGQTSCPADTQDFVVYDLTVMPPGYPSRTFHCAAAGDHGIVWVEEGIWQSDMSQAQAEEVLEAFDRATPADASQGIFERTTTAFGEPTDVDGNDRVYLLFYELGSYSGSEFDGFIRREDVLGGTHSNQAEILYLDGVRNVPTSDYVLGVIAHEFVHLIHLAHDTDERNWVEEILAEAAMLHSGYLGDLDTWVPDYLDNPNQTLTADNPGFHYGAGFLFGGYLLERFGVSFLTALVEQTEDGIVGIDATLGDLGELDTFETLLGDWALANYLDAPAVDDGRFGYTGLDLDPIASFALALPQSPITRNVQPHASYHFGLQLSVGAGAAVEIQLDSAQWQDLTFRWAAHPDGAPDQAVTGSFEMSGAADTLVIPAVGGTVDRVHLVTVELGGVTAASLELSAALQ